MSHALLTHVEQHSNSLKKAISPLRVGDRVKVHQRIIETSKDGAKERFQIFEGLVIKVSSGAGVNKTVTVRKIASGVGVEKIFPLHSKNVAQFEVVSHAKVRRSKLYYMRERTGKSARLKEGKMRGFEMPVESGNEVTEEAIEEAVEHAAEKEQAAKQAHAPEDETKVNAEATSSNSGTETAEMEPVDRDSDSKAK